MTEERYSIPLLDESWKRFLGPDDAAFLLERLGQGRIRQLWKWFESDEGLASGGLLAQEAPVFDLLLDRLCEELRSTETVADEDPFSGPSFLRDPDWAHALFGAGLMFGSSWRNDSGGNPFEKASTLVDLVHYIAQEDWVERVRADRESTRETRQDPLAVTRALLRKESLLALPIDSLRKLVIRESSAVQWCQEVPGEARALFFLGAIASGVELPGRDDGEQARLQEAEIRH